MGKVRNSVAMQELEDICKETKPNYYNNRLINNNIYAAEYILKRYANIDLHYELKVAIEHGVFRTLMIPEFIVDVPTILVYSKFRYDYVSRYTKQKLIYPIGGIIQYAKSLLTQEELVKEKERLGKNLLAFPKHGIRLIETKFDIDEYCQVLKSYESEFDTIRVCLYYDDINKGLHEIYQKYGFEVVTAGNTYNMDFFDRLKTIFTTASITTSNYAGGPLGNSIMMGVPHFITPQNIELKYNNDESCWSEYYQNQIKSYKYNMDKILLDNFTVRSEEITQKQKDIVAYYWGLGLQKSPQEIRRISHISEIIYEKGKKHFLFNGNFVEQGIEELSQMIQTLKETQKKSILKSKSLKRRVALIQSHLTPVEKLKLYSLIKGLQEQSIYVETGSFLGASAAIAGLALRKKNAKIYCLDDWNRHTLEISSKEEFDRNTQAFQEDIVAIDGEIKENAKSLHVKIDFLFIDGAHSNEEEIKNELLPLLEKVVDGGFVAIHHYYWSDSVKKVVQKYLEPMAIVYHSLPNLWIAKVTKRKLVATLDVDVSNEAFMQEIANKFKSFDVIMSEDKTYVSQIVSQSQCSKTNKIVFEKKRQKIKIYESLADK